MRGRRHVRRRANVRRTTRGLVTTAVVALLTGAATVSIPTCADAATAGAARRSYAVGIHTETLVDRQRSTPANGTVRAHPGRTLGVTIFYPALGRRGAPPARGAQPARSGGPYPLVVFAPGFGTDPDLGTYQGLLEAWASSGYVVAATLFPLTMSDAPGGPDLSDYVHQPGDLSFVVTQLLKASARRHGLLAGLLDPREVGAAGHSLGGVTVLGLVANTCCRDKRIKAAVVMSGDALSFPHGRTDYRAAPPLLLVDGDADPSVPYASSVTTFNDAIAPKGLLTVEGGDHDSPVDPSGRAFDSVVRTTTDFFDRYLKGQKAALTRLYASPEHGVTKLTFVSTRGQHVKLPVPKTVNLHREVTVTPTQDLADGQTVTVTWSGLTPGVSVNVLQCSVRQPTTATDCDLQTAKVLQPDPEGSGSLSLQIRTGAIGSGTCDATRAGCVVAVNEGGSLTPADTLTTAISFAR
jgi:dienelactone hydrolase